MNRLPFITLLIGSLLAATGCQPPTHKCWNIAVFTTDGKIVTGTVSTDHLFAAQSNLQSAATVPTHDECIDASYDFRSGRLLTIEKAQNKHFLRLYDRDGNVITEFVGENGVRFYEPTLQKGGQRFAYVSQDHICTAAPDGSPGGFTVTKHESPQARGGISLYRDRPCWTSTGFVIDVSRTIYVQQSQGGEFSPVAEDCLLCGVLPNDDILAWSYPGLSMKIWNTRTNEKVGYANMGYDYSRFLCLSPCGEYVMYEVPARLLVGPTAYIHHIRSGRRAPIRFPEQCKWVIGWDETQEE